MNREPVYKIVNEALPQIKELLKKTVYGTRGFRYSHMDTDEKLNDLVAPDFHTLWLGEELVAVAAYCKRLVSDGTGHLYNAYYIRYFSVKPKHQGKGYGKLLTKKLEHHYRSSISEKALFYAYIEKKNFRSIAVSESFQQENLGQFKSVLFSRFTPKKSDLFRRINASEYKELTSRHFDKHALFQDNKLGYKKGCYGIVVDDEIVAAIQVNHVSWKIDKIPGFLGWLGRNALHFIPILGRLSPRSKFEFSAFEGLVMKKGFEDQVIPLLESCLATQGTNIGMLYLDLMDSNYDFFLNQQKMGLMRKLQNPPAVAFLCNFLNFSDEEKEGFFLNPKYISCFDLT